MRMIKHCYKEELNLEIYLLVNLIDLILRLKYRTLANQIESKN